jgi:hypothetical protein
MPIKERKRNRLTICKEMGVQGKLFILPSSKLLVLATSVALSKRRRKMTKVAPKGGSGLSGKQASWQVVILRFQSINYPKILTVKVNVLSQNTKLWS